jgi:hypothetical protein
MMIGMGLGPLIVGAASDFLARTDSIASGVAHGQATLRNPASARS